MTRLNKEAQLQVALILQHKLLTWSFFGITPRFTSYQILVKRYILVWPQNKGHGKSVSYKTDVGTDLRRAHFKKSALRFEAAKGSRKKPCFFK